MSFSALRALRVVKSSRLLESVHSSFKGIRLATRASMIVSIAFAVLALFFLS